MTADSAVVLDEDIEALRGLIREWGAKLEDAGEFPAELYRELGAMGAFGCIFPEEEGGTATGFRALAAVAEEIAYVYPPMSAGMNVQACTVPLTIHNWGSDELVARYGPSLVSAEILG